MVSLKQRAGSGDKFYEVMEVRSLKSKAANIINFLWGKRCFKLIRSVADGRHGMPSPEYNDTGRALSQDGSNWSRDLATLTFDHGGHGACGWCGSSSPIRTPSLKLVGISIRKMWRTMCVSITRPGDTDLWHRNEYASRIGDGEPSFRIWAC